MIYVGLDRGAKNASLHWYLAITEDGTMFKHEDKGTLKEVFEYVEEMKKKTEKDVVICFDHWGAPSQIVEMAEFVSEHKGIHLELIKISGDRISELRAEQVAVNTIQKVIEKATTPATQ